MNRHDNGVAGSGVLPISRQELHDKMRDGTVVLVDAQAHGWYEREHLPGALRADIDDVDALAAELAGDPASEIVVYCWSETCEASARVSADLAGRGFAGVRRYVEGKRDWLEAGLPVESGGPTGDGPVHADTPGKKEEDR